MTRPSTPFEQLQPLCLHPRLRLPAQWLFFLRFCRQLSITIMSAGGEKYERWVHAGNRLAARCLYKVIVDEKAERLLICVPIRCRDLLEQRGHRAVQCLIDWLRVLARG